ncbi:MAG: ABC transporter substrate-binding protein [Eubacteriales bacterium]
MRNKIISLILAAMFCLPLLASCADKSGGTSSTTAAPDGSTAGQSTASEGEISDDLPAMDLNGLQFNILCRTEIDYEMSSDGETGEVINDAVYRRNRTVEDRFNVKLNFIKEKGNWDSLDGFLKKVRSSVQAGDGAFDLIAGYEAYFIRTGFEGLMTDLNSLDYLDFSKPWWTKDFQKELTIDGKLYHNTGDLSLSLWENIYVIFFNKKMIQDYGVENPYEMVKSGKWTLGKLDEISRTVTSDLDGDGKNSKEDIHGYATETGNLVDLFHAAFDMPTTTRDDNGLPVISLNTPKMVEIYEKLYSFLYENPGVWAQPESIWTADNPLIDQFTQDKVMFLPDCLGNAQGLRNMNTDFGIIPLPKWDEAQELYKTQSQNGFSIFGIPVDVKDANVSALMLEALTAESYRTVIPAYYDQALKNKFSRDDESEEMMDIARDNLVFNFGYMHCSDIDGMPALKLRELMTAKNKNFTSMYEANSKKFDTSLTKIVEMYQSIG